MFLAAERAIKSTAKDLNDYRVAGTKVALRVYSENCNACMTFDKTLYEGGLKQKHSLVHIFDLCIDGDANILNMVKEAGVSKIPAYIVLDRDTHQVIRPTLSYS